MQLAELITVAGASACASGACLVASTKAGRLLDQLRSIGDHLKQAHDAPPPNDDMACLLDRLEAAEQPAASASKGDDAALA